MWPCFGNVIYNSVLYIMEALVWYVWTFHCKIVLLFVVPVSWQRASFGFEVKMYNLPQFNHFHQRKTPSVIILNDIENDEFIRNGLETCSVLYIHIWKQNTHNALQYMSISCFFLYYQTSLRGLERWMQSAAGLVPCLCYWSLLIRAHLCPA